MPDVRGSAAYKREMAVEFSARALIKAWRRAQGMLNQRRLASVTGDAVT